MDQLTELITKPASLALWLAGAGMWAPVSLIAAQFVQVVVFVIPGEVVQIAAGYLFGAVCGTVLSTSGILLGSSVNYLVGRVGGGALLSRVLSRKGREQIDAVVARRGVQLGFFLLFVVPGIPKDILCYAAGAVGAGGAGDTPDSRRASAVALPFPRFIVLSMIGRLPGIVGSALIGAGAAGGNIWLAGGLGTAAIVLLLVGGRIIHRIATPGIGAKSAKRR